MAFIRIKESRNLSLMAATFNRNTVVQHYCLAVETGNAVLPTQADSKSYLVQTSKAGKQTNSQLV